MSFCKNCGAELKSTAAFCPKCGVKASTITPTVPKQGKPAARIDPPQRYCKLCGGKINDNTAFCPHCGADVSSVRRQGSKPKVNNAKRFSDFFNAVRETAANIRWKPVIITALALIIFISAAIAVPRFLAHPSKISGVYINPDEISDLPVLTFSKDGTFSLTDWNERIEGTYTTSGGKLTLQSDEGELLFGSEYETYDYRVKHGEIELTYSVREFAEGIIAEEIYRDLGYSSPKELRDDVKNNDIISKLAEAYGFDIQENADTLVQFFGYDNADDFLLETIRTYVMYYPDGRYTYLWNDADENGCTFSLKQAGKEISSREEKYVQAIELMNSGDAAAAQVVFDELGNYGMSSYLSSECSRRTDESTISENSEIEISANTGEISPVPNGSTQNEVSWASLYKSHLEMYAKNSNISIPMCNYSLYDIDEDGVPELFIKSGTCEADTVINVYAIRNSAVTMLDSLPGSHSGVCGLAEKNAFLLSGGHMGYETIYKLQLSNDTFIWETVFSGQVDQYHALTWLRTFALDDYSGLNWVKNDPEDNQNVLTSYSSGQEYLLPESNTRYLSEMDLLALTWEECCFARNEIFARHGRIFVTPEISQYFNSKSWYHGTIPGSSFDPNLSAYLNEYEMSNVNFISNYEKKIFGGSYY